MAVQRVEWLTPHMAAVTFTGPELEGLRVDLPAASVRLLIPSVGADLVIPLWNGNEFLLPDDSRPVIRTFTPRHVGGDTLELDIVKHDGGAISDWLGVAAPGDPAAVSGPGRGYAIDEGASGFLLAGDESALPAICQLLEALPAETPVQVIIEVAHPDARLPLPHHPQATVDWRDLATGVAPGDALLPALQAAPLEPGTRVWVAGEAAAMHRVRRHLFAERQLARDQATVRGYWKRERSSPG